jgi:hypothetical protein
VKKISKPKPKVENFREKRGKMQIFKNLRKMREKLVSLRASFFFFYLIMSVFYSGVNTGACNSSVMA